MCSLATGLPPLFVVHALQAAVCGLKHPQRGLKRSWSFGTAVQECCCWPLQDEDLDASLGQLLRTSRGVVEAVALVASLLGMLPFLYFEVRHSV
jgi:hypothetical protein